MKDDRVDDQTFIGQDVPALALVVRSIQPCDRAGVDRLFVARIDLDIVNAAVVESVAVARPFIAAVDAVVDPAACRHPHVVGLFGVDGDREHVRVEDHPLGDVLPGFTTVVRAPALAPRADVDAVLGARIDGQRLDVDLLGDLCPGASGIGAAIDAGQTANHDVVRVARINGDRANGKVFQPGVAPVPGLAAVGRNSDHAAAPQTPA